MRPSGTTSRSNANTIWLCAGTSLPAGVTRSNCRSLAHAVTDATARHAPTIGRSALKRADFDPCIDRSLIVADKTELTITRQPVPDVFVLMYLLPHTRSGPDHVAHA